FPRAAVAALRQAGHDVFWVRTDLAGGDDTQVLAHAVAEGRLLLTFDKDFGELTFQIGLPATCGVILFRIPTDSPEMVARRVVSVVGSRDEWSGLFAVAVADRVRVRPMPGPRRE